jgi:hypothetical protein
MAKDVVYIRHPPAEARAFHSPNGMVGRWVTKKTHEVAAHSIAQAPKPGQGRGYATGELARGISPERTVVGRKGPESRVVSGSDHSVFVHEGTAPHVIRPRRKEQLVFFWRKTGHVVFRDMVRHPGTPSNKFLLNALRAVFGGPGR